MRERTSLSHRIESLEAYLQSLGDGAETALAELAGKTDPESLRQRLRILIENDRSEEAAELVGPMEPHERWVEFATIAFTAVDQVDRALEMVSWSAHLRDQALDQRCRLAFARGRYRSALRSRPEEGRILPGEFEENERQALGEAMEVLKPVLDYATARGHIDNGLEEGAVRLHAHSSYLLGDRAACLSSVEILTTRTPLPLDVARFALQGVIPGDLSFLERLCTEHPGSFEAQFLDALLKSDVRGDPEGAFRAIWELQAGADTAQKREDVYKLAVDVGDRLGAESAAEADGLGAKLLGPGHRLLELREAQRSLDRGALDRAAELLERHRDDKDPFWEQLYAHLELLRSNPTAAIAHLKAATDIAALPGALRQLAALAHEHGQRGVAIAALVDLLALVPAEEGARNNLAVLYSEDGEFGRAADEFRRLSRDHPEQERYAFCEATSYLQAGQADQALEVYARLCEAESSSVEAVIATSQLLRSLNRVDEAFQVMEDSRARFWSDPGFVGTYLGLAYSAERDEHAPEALARLRELQAQGEAPPGLLEAKTLDELIEHMRAAQDQDDELSEKVARGKTSWLLVDRSQRRAAVLGWQQRTQSLSWLLEEASAFGRHCVYSTNGLSVRATTSGRHLEALEASPRGEPVVCDLSALITLQQLGLLSEAAEYFGTMFFPADYMTLLLEDASRLVPHQPSQKTVLDQLKKAVDSGRITRESVSGGTPAIVDEYAGDEEGAYYRISDLLQVLHKKGVISDQRHQRLAAGAKSGRGELALTHEEPVQIGLVTLQTLCHQGIIDEILATMTVVMSQDDHDRLLGELASFGLQDRCREWTNDLLECLRADERLVPAPSLVERALPPEHRSHVALVSSTELAIRSDRPLVVDDRYLQSGVCAERPGLPHSAFGSDKVIDALYGGGAIDAAAAAQAYASLIGWRYRFVLPPADILYAMLRDYEEYPPGQELRMVAKYVQDCMRDPGLHAGVESTTPPSILAGRLFQMWVTVMAELISTLWSKGEFREERARQVTRWIVKEALPSPPVNMGPRSYVVLEFTSRMLFGHLTLHLCGAEPDVANTAVRVVADALGISESEYLVLVTEAIDGLR
jgi:tetratricopeptide (TPR) repeat protein